MSILASQLNQNLQQKNLGRLILLCRSSFVGFTDHFSKLVYRQYVV